MRINAKCEPTETWRTKNTRKHILFFGRSPAHSQHKQHRHSQNMTGDWIFSFLFLFRSFSLCVVLVIPTVSEKYMCDVYERDRFECGVEYGRPEVNRWRASHFNDDGKSACTRETQSSRLNRTLESYSFHNRHTHAHRFVMRTRTGSSQLDDARSQKSWIFSRVSFSLGAECIDIVFGMVCDRRR